MSDDGAQPQICRQTADIGSAFAEPGQAPPQEGPDLLKYAFDVAPGGITVLDRDLNVVDTNAWVCDRYGLKTTPVGQKCYAALHDRETPCPGCPALFVLGAGQPCRFVGPYPSAEDAVAQLEVQLLPLRDGRGQIAGIAEYARDVTKCELAEENLQASEERFSALSRMMSDLAYSLHVEPDGSLVPEWITDALAYAIGLAPGEPIALRKWVDVVHPDDLGLIAKRAVTLFSGEPTVGEYRIITKGGDVRRVRDCTLPLFDEKRERIVRLVGAAQDVTERKQMEEELRRSREEHRELVENIGEAIYAMDRDGVMAYISPVVETFLGYKPSQVIDRAYTDFIYEEDLPRVRRAVQQILGGQAVSNEYRFVTKSGEIRWLRTSSRPIRTDGKVIGVQGMLTDVTEHRQVERIRRDLEAQLERARRMESLGTLAGGVAHDLNNVLGPLVAYPELILDQLPPDSPMREDILRIQRSADEAAAVVQDLLSLGRRGAYQMVPLDLNAVVEDYVTSPSYLELTARNPDVAIRIDLEPNLLNVLGASFHLFKVIMNLVTNAFEAMPHGGELTIQTQCLSLERNVIGYEIIVAGDYVALRVRDTGVGISPGDLDRIFEPFFTKKAMGQSGSGLGLSVVYGVVHDHHGRIDLESEVGRGTEFRIYFPVCREQIPEIDKDGAGACGTETVLVVDDVEAQRDLAVRLLSSLGYRVHAVDSGRAAVDHLQDNDVDILLLDMVMEDGFDGLDTYREAIRIRPDQKAVVASGFPQTERVQTAQALGAGPLVAKPYRIRELARAIRQELDGRQALGSS